VKTSGLLYTTIADCRFWIADRRAPHSDEPERRSARSMFKYKRYTAKKQDRSRHASYGRNTCADLSSARLDQSKCPSHERKARPDHSFAQRDQSNDASHERNGRPDHSFVNSDRTHARCTGAACAPKTPIARSMSLETSTWCLRQAQAAVCRTLSLSKDKLVRCALWGCRLRQQCTVP